MRRPAGRRTAVLLLSGRARFRGTCLALLTRWGWTVHALSRSTTASAIASSFRPARVLARRYGALSHRVVPIPAFGALGGSALTDRRIRVPKSALGKTRIPVTYVPARNTLFLAFALAFAETRGATEIVIGANALDYSGYPDCRPEFLTAFERMARLGTKAGREGRGSGSARRSSAITKAGHRAPRPDPRARHEPNDVVLRPRANSAAPCGKCDACLLERRDSRRPGKRY